VRAHVLTILTSCLFIARAAAAFEGTTGYSGKPYDGVGATCKTCHLGNGKAPTLDITVPTTMKAGETAQVTIVVKGSLGRTSMNAALSDGVAATKGSNTSIPFPETPGEVAAVAPPPSGGTGTYKFSFVAPQKNGPVTLWVAGMSASGSGTAGDGVATTTRTITVSGATESSPDRSAPPDAGIAPSPISDPGADSDSISDPADDVKGTGGDNATTGDDDDDNGFAGTGSSRRLRGNTGEASGCSAVHTHAPETSVTTLAVGIAILAVARRRRTRHTERR
jgi:hypothetical protein